MKPGIRVWSPELLALPPFTLHGRRKRSLKKTKRIFRYRQGMFGDFILFWFFLMLHSLQKASWWGSVPSAGCPPGRAEAARLESRLECWLESWLNAGATWWGPGKRQGSSCGQALSAASCREEPGASPGVWPPSCVTPGPVTAPSSLPRSHRDRQRGLGTCAYLQLSPLLRSASALLVFINRRHSRQCGYFVGLFPEERLKALADGMPAATEQCLR